MGASLLTLAKSIYYCLFFVLLEKLKLGERTAIMDSLNVFISLVRMPAFLHRAFCLLQEGKKIKVPLLKQIKDIYFIINVR